jgi:hypothetical protein
MGVPRDALRPCSLVHKHPDNRYCLRSLSCMQGGLAVKNARFHLWD